jgi:uncharacterized protein YjcR
MNKADNNTVLLAEKLYINDNMTCTEIADTIGKSRATVEKWARKYGWKEKRADLIGSRRALPQRIFELWNKVTTRIEKDIDEGREVSASRYRLASQLFEQIPKAEQVEKAASGKPEEKKTDPRQVAAAVREYLELDETETEDKKQSAV